MARKIKRQLPSYFIAGVSLACTTMLTCSTASLAQVHVLQVDASRSNGAVQPTMWGIFFEDINLGADGGIYAELVKNRSFEFIKPLMGWDLNGKKLKEGSFLLINEAKERPNNPRFLQVSLSDAAAGDLGLVNEGFRGMGIKKDLAYDFSIQYRRLTNPISLLLQLKNSSGKIIGSGQLTLNATGDDWQQASTSFRATDTAASGQLQIWLVGNGQVDLDQVSFFPGDTWKGRKGGLRADMVQALADLKPGFIRFPGGCIVEGHELSTRYQWKKTVGPVANRPLSINRWNNEFAERAAPDYFQTFGLGFFEYFQLAEDIGAEPLPILSCGMACQFNSAELVPLDELEPYIQDAIDLIEFANGDTQTKWGALRASMGHPAPFNLKMMGIGNENWGPQYLERVKVFAARLKAQHPEVKLITSAGPFSSGEMFDTLDKGLRALQVDFIDEHYYMSPDWFLRHANRYDHYDRQGPKIFAGEYAAHPPKQPQGPLRNNWQAALSEAAFMTGLERNAAVVEMCSYAPLFAHIDGWQWSPDLIWVDNLNSYPTPNYYVQQLYSLNKGTKTISIEEGGKALSGQDSLYASAVLDEKQSMLIIKLVNADGVDKKTVLNLKGLRIKAKEAERIDMKSTDPLAVNVVGAAPKLIPQKASVAIKTSNWAMVLPANSFTVLRIPYQK